MNAPAPLCRSRVYGALSLAFSDPDPAVLHELRRALAVSEESLRALGDAASGAQAHAARAIVARMSLARWRAAHVRCFGYAISKECPPYEAEYDQANLFQQTQTLADIAGFYRAFGLETAPALHERADHIGIELEFMQFLCLKEAHAAGRGETPERVAHCRTSQAKFLERHLGVWACAFARRLRGVAGEGLYAALAQLLEAFLAAETAQLGVRPAAGGRLNEAPEAPDDACGARCGGPAAASRVEVVHERT
ncbi:MAG: molecular chaperone TorD family protein [Burkholderiales bacterium]|nr:molecular chaperone TorD family protein [Burkholderiales bacterium]